MSAPDLLLLPPGQLEARLAKLPPDRREAVAQFAAKSIHETPFLQTPAGRVRAWENALEEDRLGQPELKQRGGAAPDAKNESADPERFTRVVVSAPDFVAKEYPKPRSLVGDGILCAGDLAILYGRPGCGKTWGALQLAVGLVERGSWFGLPTGGGMPARVGILELELHAFRIQERLRVLKVDRRHAALRLVSRPDLAGRVDLMSDSDLRALEKWCRDDGLDLLILDALSRIHQEDENRDMGKVLGSLDALRHATGTAPLIIHHEPKATSGQGRKIDDLDALRGDSRLQSDPTCLLRLVKLNGGLRTLRFAKVNNAHEPAPLFLQQADDGTLELTDPPAAVKDRNVGKVREALEAAGRAGLTRKELEARTGLSKGTVSAHLLTLQAVPDAGKVPHYRLASESSESGGLDGGGLFSDNGLRGPRGAASESEDLHRPSVRPPYKGRNRSDARPASVAADQGAAGEVEP